MDARRSFILACARDELCDFAAKIGQFDPSPIPYVTPANDNIHLNVSLLARSRALLRYLFAQNHRAHWARRRVPGGAEQHGPAALLLKTNTPTTSFRLPPGA
jgi:hypothetical protein